MSPWAVLAVALRMCWAHWLPRCLSQEGGIPGAVWVLSLVPWYVGMGLYFCTYVASKVLSGRGAAHQPASLRFWFTMYVSLQEAHRHHFLPVEELGGKDRIRASFLSGEGNREGINTLFSPQRAYLWPQHPHCAYCGKIPFCASKLESLDCWIMLPFPPDVWTKMQFMYWKSCEWWTKSSWLKCWSFHFLTMQLWIVI